MTQPGPTDDQEHLQPDEAVAYLHGTLTPDEHGRVERHLAECRTCTAEIGDLVRLTARKTGPIRRVQLGALAAAAALLLVVWTGRAPRTGSPTPTRDEPSLAAPSPVSPIGTSGPATAFGWVPAAPAKRYRVVLFDSTGATLFEGETEDTTLALPDSVTLAPGALYLWKVESEISFDRWASSRLVRFRPTSAGRP